MSVNLRTATEVGTWCASCRYQDGQCCRRVAGCVSDAQVCDLYLVRDPADDLVVTLPSGDEGLDPQMMSGDDDDDVMPTNQLDMVSMAKGELLITKADEAQGLVFGWANVSASADGETVIDAHGDEILIEELEKAAYGHVLEFRATGESHRGDVKGQLVESMVFTPEKLEVMGLAKGALPSGWWVGYKIEDPQLFADVQSGKFRSFSIQGIGQVDEEMTE